MDNFDGERQRSKTPPSSPDRTRFLRPQDELDKKTDESATPDKERYEAKFLGKRAAEGPAVDSESKKLRIDDIQKHQFGGEVYDLIIKCDNASRVCKEYMEEEWCHIFSERKEKRIQLIFKIRHELIEAWHKSYIDNKYDATVSKGLQSTISNYEKTVDIIREAINTRVKELVPNGFERGPEKQSPAEFSQWLMQSLCKNIEEIISNKNISALDRCRIVNAVGKLKQKEVVKIFAPMVDDKRICTLVRCEMVKFIGEYGCEINAKNFIARINKEKVKKDVRCEMVKAIGKLMRKEAVKIFAPMLNNGGIHHEVCCEMVKAIGKLMRKEAVKIFAPMLNNGGIHHEVCCEMVKVIGEYGDIIDANDFIKIFTVKKFMIR